MAPKKEKKEAKAKEKEKAQAQTQAQKKEKSCKWRLMKISKCFFDGSYIIVLISSGSESRVVG